MRGCSPLICWWMATMLMPSLRMALSTACNSFSVMAKSPSITASLSRPAKAAPCIDAHLLADGGAVHGGWPAGHNLEHALAGLALHTENGFERCGSDGVFRWDSRRAKTSGGNRVRRPELGDFVPDVLHASRQRGGVACTSDMHEINFRPIEEEVVVQGCHFETAVERGAHGRVDLILE